MTPADHVPLTGAAPLGGTDKEDDMAKPELSEKEAKAVQMVKDRRVSLTYVGEEVITATVEGSSGQYHVTLDPEGEHCTCPASTLGHRKCSHILATELERAYQVQKEGDK